MSALGLLEIAENQAEWQRLVSAVELTPGFALFVVVVSDPALAEPVEGEIQALMESLRIARCGGRHRAHDRDPLEVLLAAHPSKPCHQTLVLTPRGFRHEDPERATTLLMRLNQRRDVIRTRLAGPLFLIADRELMRTFPALAPDLWSAHTAVFRFGRGVRLDAIDIARFLILDYDVAGLLGLVPGYVEREPWLVPSLEIPIPDRPTRLYGREHELARLDALLGSKSTIVVSGSPGCGKTALLSTFAHARAERGERILWINGADESAALVMHSVLAALRPGVQSPRCVADLRREFVRATSQTPVLIVVDDWDRREELPGLGHASTLFVVTERVDDDSSDIRLPWLDPQTAQALWTEIGGTPCEWNEARRYHPGTLYLAARSGVSPTGPTVSHPWQIAPHILATTTRSFQARLGRLSRQVPDIPLQYLAQEDQSVDDVRRMMSELENAGILGWDTAGFWLADRGFGMPGFTIGLVEAHEAEILAGLDAPMHQRLLRRASKDIGYYDEERAPKLSPALYWAIARTLHPSERLEWLRKARALLAEPADVQRELADELLRQHARPRITAWPEDPLRWHAATLQRGDRLGQAAAAALIVDHADALALLHACLDPLAPLPAEHPRIAALILSLRRPDAAPLDASEPSPDLPAEHFRLVSLVWQRLRADEASESFELMLQLRASAERWGDPLALLRADLLEAYAREAIGDPARALELYEVLAPRVDELFDTHGSEALWLLLRRAVLSERTGQHAEAVQLANDAWIRLRYVDQADPSLLREITQLFIRQARFERAELALARWREAVESEPEQLREALALERELLLGRRDAELARIEASLAKAGPESDDDQGPP